jgi:hypothetical protein
VKRLVVGALVLVAVIAVGIAVFTTFDSVSVGTTSCGSPIDPVTEDGGCREELGHARATRTAALAWGLIALAVGWAVESGFRRRGPNDGIPRTAP